MKYSSNLFFFSFLLIIITTIANIRATTGDSPHHHLEKNEVSEYYSRPTKLFVFGDSYADTGNLRKSLASSWKQPYGLTFPGKPAGRFSDGRVLTDYFAKFFGLKSPIAYTLMKMGGNNNNKVRNGMNFAFGGSGVFDASGNSSPNMSTQIDFFKKLIMIKINESNTIYTKRDLKSSVVLVTLVGNDYAAYTARPDATAQGLRSFIPLVVNQLAANLKRIKEMGACKIVVTALQPLGCLPQMTQLSSFKQCNATQNLVVNYHNLLLQQAVSKLNNETKHIHHSIFILDLFDSFTTVLNQKGDYQGDLKFETPLKPCCMGISRGYSCGSVDGNGTKMYTVCSDPKSSFFWDALHPTQAGWRAVYMVLKSSLEQFFKFY
ncbi:hypothetical protein RD792_014085 [Penstemon davidsonii]|uniref:GDSL esterase/lipase At5g03610-like n=1 Tax=Penstemon davidsonii TaxID=160366 RepID=A0ABR0CNH6_9LAMI|nr:hypothetical protein RD792_014085 [Penstemon davidsonii]